MKKENNDIPEMSAELKEFFEWVNRYVGNIPKKDLEKLTNWDPLKYFIELNKKGDK